MYDKKSSIILGIFFWQLLSCCTQATRPFPPAATRVAPYDFVHVFACKCIVAKTVKNRRHLSVRHARINVLDCGGKTVRASMVAVRARSGGWGRHAGGCNEKLAYIFEEIKYEKSNNTQRSTPNLSRRHPAVCLHKSQTHTCQPAPQEGCLNPHTLQRRCSLRVL